MNLFTTKKATAIYRLSKMLLILGSLLLSNSLMAQADLFSYCFEDSVRLSSVHQSLSFLLLPKDTVNLREHDHCIDIVASADRGKLFEKFLAGRYNLKQEKGDAVMPEHCILNLKTTTVLKSDSSLVKFGEKNLVKKSEQNSTTTSQMEFVLSQGIQGELEAGPERLKVICRLNGEIGDLQFQFANSGRGSLSSQFRVKRGEWLNIGSVLKDLNDKNKTLGIPQTEVSETTGKSETRYDLQIK